jgi:hypothetical protein
MMPYEKFDAWKFAHRLALEVYEVTDNWPSTERYQLTLKLVELRCQRRRILLRELPRGVLANSDGI